MRAYDLQSLQARAASLAFGSHTTRLVELVLFGCLLPFIGILAFKADPLGLDAGFPWAIAGALIFAARYGSLWGISCAVMTGMFINLPLEAYAGGDSQHVTLALGTLVLSLVIGDTASTWRKRSQQSNAENAYLRHRLQEFSTDYHILKVSHGQLEEHMAGQRLSLREALQRLRPALMADDEGLHAGSELMAVFSQFCSIQVAGLYAMTHENLVNPEPVATHGEMIDLPMFDPLLRAALKERELVSIKLESLAEKHHNRSLLAVVPLVDTTGKLHGVLAIKDMHFMAFQQQNLNVLALLGSYAGNMLSNSASYAESRMDWFMTELDTVLRYANVHDTESVLLSFEFNKSEHSLSAARFISESIRGLDASWLTQNGQGNEVLCLLLPLMNMTQGQLFVQRIENAVQKQFGTALNTLVRDSQARSIDGSDTREDCLIFLGRHIEPPAEEAIGVA